MSELASRLTVGLALVGLWLAAHAAALYAPIGIAVHICIATELAWQLQRLGRDERAKHARAVLVFAVAAVGARYATVLCMLPRDTVLTLLALCAVSDAAQYAAGRSVGRIRLRYLSPNKTLEGYFGGLVAVCAAAPVCNLSVLAAAQVFATGVAGDLAASGLKRALGIRHFSRILGEHGGVSDRLDSFVGAVVLGAVCRIA